MALDCVITRCGHYLLNAAPKPLRHAAFITASVTARAVITFGVLYLRGFAFVVTCLPLLESIAHNKAKVHT